MALRGRPLFDVSNTAKAIVTTVVLSSCYHKSSLAFLPLWSVFLSLFHCVHLRVLHSLPPVSSKQTGLFVVIYLLCGSPCNFLSTSPSSFAPFLSPRSMSGSSAFMKPFHMFTAWSARKLFPSSFLSVVLKIRAHICCVQHVNGILPRVPVPNLGLLNLRNYLLSSSFYLYVIYLIKCERRFRERNELINFATSVCFLMQQKLGSLSPLQIEFGVWRLFQL